jgi:hypothetical protein
MGNPGSGMLGSFVDVGELPETPSASIQPTSPERGSDFSPTPVQSFEFTGPPRPLDTTRIGNGVCSSVRNRTVNDAIFCGTTLRGGRLARSPLRPAFERRHRRPTQFHFPHENGFRNGAAFGRKSVSLVRHSGQST